MLECEFCGSTAADVETAYDPFDLEINGELTELTACEGWFAERAAEI